MTLFVVDGTWSRDFNGSSLGKDNRGKSIGNQDGLVYSNSRKFYMSSHYDDANKFYYGGVFHPSGLDSRYLLNLVMDKVLAEIVSGNCKELSFVGWSRGAAIITELVELLAGIKQLPEYKVHARATRRGWRVSKKLLGYREMLPSIKFVGLFDSVSMNIGTPEGFFSDNQEWAELIPETVDYYAHVIAGDRTGPYNLRDFSNVCTVVKAKKQFNYTMVNSTHSDVGGLSHTPSARVAYRFIKYHSELAGLI